MKDLTPEQFKEMLKKDGVDVSIEQAVSILKFLTMLAEITIDNYLKESNQSPDQPDDTDK